MVIRVLCAEGPRDAIDVNDDCELRSVSSERPGPEQRASASHASSASGVLIIRGAAEGPRDATNHGRESPNRQPRDGAKRRSGFRGLERQPYKSFHYHELKEGGRE